MYSQETIGGLKYHRTWTPLRKQTTARILIMNLGHIGDFWMSLPALRQARLLFGSAHITLAVSSWNLSIAKTVNVADEIVALDYFPEQAKADAAARIFQQNVVQEAITLGEFDLAIDIRVPDDTRFIIEGLRAKQKFAFYKDRKGEFRYSLPQTPLSVRIKRKYRIFSKLGFKKKERKIRENFAEKMEHCAINASRIINYAYANSEFSKNTTSIEDVSENIFSVKKDGRAVVAVVPFSNSALRDWPFERYRELILALLDKTKADIHLICNGKNLRVHEIVAVSSLQQDLSSNERFVLKDALSRDEFYSALAAANLVISNNSGAGHVAAQLSVPTIGIYTASHLPDIWGFVGPKVSMISGDVECAGCGLDFDESRCPNGMKCRSMIGVNAILEESRFLLTQFT
jgi:ADP-heptose:LPS heptosyltransferase